MERIEPGFREELPAVVAWPITTMTRPAALDGMAKRATSEMSQVTAGADLVEVHGEALQSYGEYERFIHGALLFLKLTGHRISGPAADLGSGTGVGACILSRLERIAQVYAVEYSEATVTEVMPAVFQRFGAKLPKIQRVVGDFNALRFDNCTLGLITEIGAFHHSENLRATISESWRVLRPGGVLVMMDRAWPDTCSQDELDAMLDRQLPDSLKMRYGIPLSADFTRRDWGEHEYRVGDWLAMIAGGGFEAIALEQRCLPLRPVNAVLRRLPTLEMSILVASLSHRRGRARLDIYGVARNRVAFICVKR